MEGWSGIFELSFRVMAQCYGTGNEAIFKRVILTEFMHDSVGKESALKESGPEFISSGSQVLERWVGTGEVLELAGLPA